jgi:phenylpropionate dioxygenase-like ring-hydroxylating dioxygenase large terminal subunit
VNDDAVMAPYPRSWFQVGYSEDLEPGSVEPIHYFDRDLVLFRTESGVARVFDAYCARLGANFGFGGTIRGECLRCPFHGWEYDGAGRCVDIYRASITPASRSWFDAASPSTTPVSIPFS